MSMQDAGCAGLRSYQASGLGGFVFVTERVMSRQEQNTELNITIYEYTLYVKTLMLVFVGDFPH